MTEATTDQQDEILNILNRDGAIHTLREMRLEMRKRADTEYDAANVSLAERVQMLETDLETFFPVVYALSVMVSGVLGDPELANEVQRDMEVK